MDFIKTFLELLNSNLGIITLAVGSFAIGLYIKQKRDYKRDIATLVLQEIRYAEQHVRNYRQFGNYPLACKLVPTNSWYSNIHIFARDFKETDIDLISNFYARVSYVDNLITSISNAKIKSLVPVSVQTTPSQNSPQDNPQSTSQFERVELGAQKILKEVSDKIEFIYNTPTIDRLRVIARKRWYQII